MDVSLLHNADLILWVTLFMGMGLTFFLYKIFPHEKWYSLLLGIRTLVLFFLVILLLNPVLNLSGENEKELHWAIFVDNSASIKYHKTPSIQAIQSGIQSFVDRLSEKNISYDFTKKIILPNKLKQIFLEMPSENERLYFLEDLLNKAIETKISKDFNELN